MHSLITLLVLIFATFWGLVTLLIVFKLILKNKDNWAILFGIVSYLILFVVMYIIIKQGITVFDFSSFMDNNFIPKK